METFIEEWLALVKSKSGERGIFSRVAAQKQASRWGRRSATAEYGCNPCSEILLLDGEFCNLTEVVVRAEDTFETLKRKVELCTILGTYQSTLTDFNFIDPEVKENCDKERLLGVSMTGVMDHPVLNTVSAEASKWLQELRDYSRSVNKKWAAVFGINESAAIQCNKPSGTVGQLTNVGTGGLHPRFSQYYIRTVRQDNKDPLTKFLQDQGVYNEPDVMKPDNTTVFYFPVKGPKEAVFRDDRTAIQQLEHWLMFQRDWCEHKPSITIYVKEHEWLAVGAWVYGHFDEVSGVSFLPFSDHTYRQAPFMPISEQEYEEWISKMPENIDWSKFIELDDQTISSQELACTGGTCSIV
jgi:ribonucleoside-diphosphate reductase alpha chain